jgi:polyphosphate kinase 2
MGEAKEKAKNGKKGHKGHKKERPRAPLPAVIDPGDASPRIETKYGPFDLDDLTLPDWVEKKALKSGGYPYSDHLDSKVYEEELERLQVELVKLQRHVNDKGPRMVLLFEGRDAAGKGGSIFALTQYLNPRTARSVALPKPTQEQLGQWYFQRYVAHLPTSGEIVLFDRSWYNRAGVEPVMGFCTPEQSATFLEEAPNFEKMLIAEGILLHKFWIEISRATQLKRFFERRHDPLKIWKLSSVDYAAMTKWDDYTEARDRMFAATHTRTAPWTVVLGNDKRRARLAIIRSVLDSVDYEGKDAEAVGKPDAKILNGPGLIGA